MLEVTIVVLYKGGSLLWLQKKQKNKSWNKKALFRKNLCKCRVCCSLR